MKTLCAALLFALLMPLSAQAAEECLAKDLSDVERCTKRTIGKSMLRENLIR